MAITRRELIDNLESKFYITKVQAKSFIAALFDEMNKVILNQESLNLSSFGNFVQRDKRPRPGRNPRNGQACIISARKVLKFRTGNKLLSLINKRRM